MSAGTVILLGLYFFGFSFGQRGAHGGSAAKAAGEKALRLNPSHSYPPFLLYSLMGQMGAGDSEESGAMVSRAIRNHCHHGGGASAALQKRCKDHIMQGNLNLFV